MMERPRRSRKSLPIKHSTQSKEMVDHVIPYEVIKDNTSDVIGIKCSYCCKMFDNVDTHKEHDCRKVKDFLKCASCEKPYVDHCLNNTEKASSEEQSKDGETTTGSDIHSVKSPYQCCVCQKCFPDLSFTVRHIKYHVSRQTTEPSLRCGQCGKVFVTKQQLSKHETVHTNARPFQCDECSKWFKTADNVKRHMFVHSDARPFPCVKCGKEFKAKHMLRKHVETHNDQRLYECPECDKKYKAKNSLRDHLRVHTGQRPYKCELCDQAFYRPSHLATHKLVHTKAKPFACEECDKRFGRREHLKVHERIHSGEKPFKCTLCDRSFNQQAGLQAHLVSHSEERPHPCAKCNRTFKYLSQIKHHACKPQTSQPRVQEGVIGNDAGSQDVHMDTPLPEGMRQMTDDGNSTAGNPCLNPTNTIILIQIQNNPEVPLFTEEITGTHQLMGHMRGPHGVNEGALEHDGGTVLEQGQLNVQQTIASDGGDQGMAVGMEDLVTREILE